MFLTAYNLAHYLVGRGLITLESVVDGDFILAEAGRRNRNFKVARRRFPGIFVKQVKSTEAQAIMTIQREAAFYRAITGDPRYTEISGMIPKFLDYDASRHALALNLTEDAESLSEHQMRLSVIPPEIAQRLGSALARIHSFGTAVAADTTLRPSLPCQIPGRSMWTRPATDSSPHTAHSERSSRRPSPKPPTSPTVSPPCARSGSSTASPMAI